MKPKLLWRLYQIAFALLGAGIGGVLLYLGVNGLLTGKTAGGLKGQPAARWSEEPFKFLMDDLSAVGFGLFMLVGFSLWVIKLMAHKQDSGAASPD